MAFTDCVSYWSDILNDLHWGYALSSLPLTDRAFVRTVHDALLNSMIAAGL